jgi:hypothetical protein
MIAVSPGAGTPKLSMNTNAATPKYPKRSTIPSSEKASTVTSLTVGPSVPQEVSKAEGGPVAEPAGWSPRRMVAGFGLVALLFLVTHLATRRHSVR